MKKTAASFRKSVGWLHLILGFSSGLVVFIVALTGALYVFRAELEPALNPCCHTAVKTEQRDFLHASALIDTVKRKLPQRAVTMLTYEGSGRAVKVWYQGKGDQWGYAALNPYDASVLCLKEAEAFDFFTFVVQGHYRLWIPYEWAGNADIGNQIVGYGTVVFALLMVTGMILWWPRNKQAAKQRFRIKWKAKWKRTNYDLHAVLGFYACWIVIFMAVTGLAWSFEGFDDALYYAASGGNHLPLEQRTVSDTSGVTQTLGLQPVDRLTAAMRRQHPAGKIEIVLPQSAADVYQVWLSDSDPDKQYLQRKETYDRYSLKKLPASGMWSLPYEKGNVGDKLRRLYVPVHYGSIFGFSTKILAFFASLLAASLPVTGGLMWWGRRNKSNGQSKK